MEGGYNHNFRYDESDDDSDSAEDRFLSKEEIKREGEKNNRERIKQMNGEKKKDVFDVVEYEKQVREELGMKRKQWFAEEYGKSRSIGKKIEAENNEFNTQEYEEEKENEFDTKRTKGFETKTNKSIGNEKYRVLGEESNDGTETAKTEKKIGRKRKPKANDSYKEYDPHDIASFLELIEDHPVIWDKSRENCFRREVHLKVFDEIEEQCSKFMPRGKNTHGTCAKKLWIELEADYKKHLTKVQRAKSGSGSDDVKSDFLFFQNMLFLNGAAQKRAVRNAYIIGTEKTIMESGIVDLDDDESGDTLKSLSIVTPKRKRQQSKEETPRRSAKQRRQEYLMDKIDESAGRIEKLVGEVLEGPKTESACQSSRICKIFEAHTKEWPEVERYLAEAKVLAYIRSLTTSNNPSSSNSYNVPSNPNLSSFSNYPSSSNSNVPPNPMLSSLSTPSSFAQPSYLFDPYFDLNNFSNN